MSKNRKLFSALILILVGSLVQWAPSANATPKHVMKRDGSKVVTSAHPRYINADTQTTCLYAARPSGYVPTSLSITAGCGAYSTFGYNTVTWSAVQDGVSACLAVANSTYLGVGANYVPSRLSFNSKCGANSSYGYNTVTWSTIQDGVSACLAVANSTYLRVGANYVPTRLTYDSKCGPNSSYG